jgi:glutamine---fructose-6-phosphate transaminase (isomerizing)
MCGITALLINKENNENNNTNVYNILLESLKQLQNRGYDSAGIAIMDRHIFEEKQQIQIYKYASTEKEDSIALLEKHKPKIQEINETTETTENSVDNIYVGIGHTRWATHGGKTDKNSHPHLSYNGKICLVHNGIIENFQEIKTFLINKGIRFQSQTDTEVIVNLLAYEYEKTELQNNSKQMKSPDIFRKTIENVIGMLQGTWGLAILNTDYPETLFVTRHGSPLLIGKNDDEIMVVSEKSGFCNRVNNYFILESMDIAIVHKNKITTNKTYKETILSKQEFDLTPEPYPHWTIKEIYEQYEASLRAVSYGGRLMENTVKMGGLYENKEKLQDVENLILLGCGTSYFAGLYATHYFKDLCNFNTVQLFDGAEFNEKDIPKKGQTVVILLSQSGETKDLHRCIKIGRENNCVLLGVVNVVDSMIAREVDGGCYLNAGREVGVASTKSFTNQVIVLSMMSIWFSELQNVNKNKRMKYIKDLRQLTTNIKEILENLENIDKTKLFEGFLQDNMFLLGKGKSEAIAKEGALKIKEISYIHSEGYSGSSLKHGPFALLDEKFPVILLINKDEHEDKMKNCYQEVKSRNAPILVIGNSDLECEYKMKTPKNETYQDLLCVFYLQYIAYIASIEKGINPDKPKNLAKCVVVE